MSTPDRRVVFAPVECRKAENGQEKLVGHGAIFNRETVVAGLFREKVTPGAFTDSLKEDDIRVMFNHDPNHVIARQSAGNVVLEEDATGLRYEAEVDRDDPDAVSVAAKVRRRIVTGSSFSFTIDRDEDEEWFPPERRGGLPLRVIRRARVFDVGPVTFPAYAGADAGIKVSMRSMDKASALATEERAAAAAVETPPVPESPIAAQEPPAPVVKAPATTDMLRRQAARLAVEAARLCQL